MAMASRRWWQWLVSGSGQLVGGWWQRCLGECGKEKREEKKNKEEKREEEGEVKEKSEGKREEGGGRLDMVWEEEEG